MKHCLYNLPRVMDSSSSSSSFTQQQSPYTYGQEYNQGPSAQEFRTMQEQLSKLINAVTTLANDVKEIKATPSPPRKKSKGKQGDGIAPATATSEVSITQQAKDAVMTESNENAKQKLEHKLKDLIRTQTITYLTHNNNLPYIHNNKNISDIIINTDDIAKCIENLAHQVATSITEDIEITVQSHLEDQQSLCNSFIEKSGLSLEAYSKMTIKPTSLFNLVNDAFWENKTSRYEITRLQAHDCIILYYQIKPLEKSKDANLTKERNINPNPNPIFKKWTYDTC